MRRASTTRGCGGARTLTPALGDEGLSGRVRAAEGVFVSRALTYAEQTIVVEAVVALVCAQVTRRGGPLYESVQASMQKPQTTQAPDPAYLEETSAADATLKE